MTRCGMLNPNASFTNRVVEGHGATCRSEGGVRFRLWAPGQRQMQLAIEGLPDLHAMRPLADGWHELTHPNCDGGRALSVRAA